jgi:II/X family phage/plasmid replication protein
MIMVDWITARIPYSHNTPINGGHVVSVDRSGSVDWQTAKYLSVAGSYESSVSLRSYHDPEYLDSNSRYSHIEFSGNPVKFLQGHNIWGSGDAPNLLAEALLKALSLIGVDVASSLSIASILASRLTRIDLTAMYQLKNPSEVNNWLRSAEFSANLRHRGKGQFNHGTLYYGARSSHWTLKFYHKGQELRANKKHQRADILELKSLLEFADKSLRSEIQFRARELDKLGLSTLKDWNDSTALEVYNTYLGRLEFSENMTTINNQKLQELPPRLAGAYQLWVDGKDLRQIYPRPTFYRYRKELLNLLKVDISIKQQSEKQDMSNVVPLVRIIEAKPASIPAWAYGTDLFHEPKHYPFLASVN